jgi:hypothetical protein
MENGGKQKLAFALIALIAVISVAQLDETFSAISFWWKVNHATSNQFAVPHWWTHYTIASALFASLWLTCSVAALFMVRRRPGLALIALSAFPIVEPISCASAPSFDRESGNVLGLETLPFADAERNADRRHLVSIDERIKNVGGTAGFPLSEVELLKAVGNPAFEASPYVRAGKRIPFDLRLIANKGTPYPTSPERPGIVYYAVNPDGKEFVLTISGLNTPTCGRASMMKEVTWIGSKQPWGGLLAIEETLYQK